MRFVEILRVVLLILLALVFVAGVSLGFENSSLVHFDYLLGVVDISLIGLLLIVIAASVALTLIVCGVKYLSIRNELRGLRKQLRKAESELKTLRNLPPIISAAPTASPTQR